MPNWHEGRLESLVSITVWVFVFVATRRILETLLLSRGPTPDCGWCRKLKGRAIGSRSRLPDKRARRSKPPRICTNCGRRVFLKRACRSLISGLKARRCYASVTAASQRFRTPSDSYFLISSLAQPRRLPRLIQRYPYSASRASPRCERST